jgi:hypothetical protein
MLKLENGYSIRANRRCFILVKETNRINKDGETVVISKGYFTRLDQALESYIDQMLLEAISEFDMNLSGVKAKLEELRKELASYDIEAVMNSASKDSVEIIEEDNEEDS